MMVSLMSLLLIHHHWRRSPILKSIYTTHITLAVIPPHNFYANQATKTQESNLPSNILANLSSSSSVPNFLFFITRSHFLNSFSVRRAWSKYEVMREGLRDSPMKTISCRRSPHGGEKSASMAVIMVGSAGQTAKRGVWV